MLHSLLTPLLIVFAFHSSISWAVDCANDDSGAKGASDMTIMKAINAANDPLSQAFQKLFPTQGTICPTCGASAAMAAPKGAGDVQKIGNALYAQPKIKKECIVAALNRKIPANTDAYACAGKTPKTIDKNQCITDRGARYIEFALSQAMSCLSTPESPIDPRTVLKKLNNESGFNFFIASEGGVGIGQLISAPPKELAGWTTDKGKIGRAHV